MVAITYLSELLRMASAVANFAGKGRPSTFGAVSRTSIIHARKWRRVSSSRDIAALPTPPDRTADGFMDPLQRSVSLCHARSKGVHPLDLREGASVSFSIHAIDFTDLQQSYANEQAASLLHRKLPHP